MIYSIVQEKSDADAGAIVMIGRHENRKQDSYPDIIAEFPNEFGNIAEFVQTMFSKLLTDDFAIEYIPTSNERDGRSFVTLSVRDKMDGKCTPLAIFPHDQLAFVKFIADFLTQRLKYVRA